MIQFVPSSLIGDALVTKAGIRGIELHDFRSIYFKFCNVIRISYLNLNGEEGLRLKCKHGFNYNTW